MDEAEIKRIIEEAIKDSGKGAQGTALKNAMESAFRSAAKSSEVQKLNKEIKEQIKNQKLSNEATEELNDAIDELTKSQEDLIKASEGLTEQYYKLAKGTGLNIVQSQRLAEKAVSARDTLEQLGTAAYKGSGKISDFTSAFKGKLGGAGDAFVKVGTSLQNNIDNYRTLSNVGAAFGQNLVELRETAAQAGLPIEDFVTLISKNSEVLAQTYGSATQGAKAFAQLSESFRRTDIEFLAPLGLTIDDFNSALLTTINLQRLTGTFERDNIKGQTESARGLITEIDKLAKLTGIQRTQLQKQLEAQMAQATFAAYAQNQTEETRLRMQTFAATISEIAPEMKTGLLDLIANQGVATTQAGKELVMNMQGASGVINSLQSGAITTEQALQQFQAAARSGEQGLRGVAQTGTVGFVNNMYPAMLKVTRAQMNFADVTDEAAKRSDSLTKQLSQFQDASKRLSASFQSLETGFFRNLGGALGLGIDGMNKGMKDLAIGINSLSSGSKALLYIGTSLSSFVLDKATQVGVVFAGTLQALKVAGFTDKGVFGTLGGLGGGKVGKYGTMAGRGLGIAGGGLGIGLGAYEAYNADSASGKLIGMGEGAIGGALMGAQIGAMGGPLGALIGAGIGALGGAAVAGIAGGVGKPVSRATGTLGEIGLPFEPRTSNLQVHAGERVLNPTEAQEYNAGGSGGNAQYAQLNAQMTQYNMTAKEALELQKANYKALNTLVNINMATEKNTKKTSKVVDKVGPSIV
jgi:hypothetical protein